MKSFTALAAALAAFALVAHPPAPGPSPVPDREFRGKVRPILARSCTPCHVPGGKMYGRLPFDDPRVVRDHKEGVLRRLKGSDRETVAAWAR